MLKWQVGEVIQQLTVASTMVILSTAPEDANASIAAGADAALFAAADGASALAKRASQTGSW
jgi:hypothetical protein